MPVALAKYPVFPIAETPLRLICDEHDHCAGFLICKHVTVGGHLPSRIERPGLANNGIGAILCRQAECEHHHSTLSLICEVCAREKGYYMI